MKSIVTCHESTTMTGAPFLLSFCLYRCEITSLTTTSSKNLVIVLQGVQVHHIRGDLELSNVSFAYQMRPSHLVGQRIDLDPSSNGSILPFALTVA